MLEATDNGDPEEIEDDASDGFPDPTPDTPEESNGGDSRESAELDSALVASLFEECSRIKDAGNTLFKAGDNAAAIVKYQEAITMSDGATLSDEAKETMKPVLLSLHNNSAAAHVKLEHWEEAARSASAVLDIEAANSKALFRRGVARSKLGQLSSAHDDLMAACRADPKDRAARAELMTVQTALKAQRDAERADFSSKFGSAAEKAVAREEAREAARKREEARVKAAAEEKLRSEWQAECARLREQQRAEREATRRARLKRFLGAESAAAEATAAHGGEGEDSATVEPPSTDRSEWARGELMMSLIGLQASTEDGLRARVEGVRKLEGSASIVHVAGQAAVPFFEYSFALDWSVEGTVGDGSAANASSRGSLIYSEVVPAEGGKGVSVGEVTHEVDEGSGGDVAPPSAPDKQDAEGDKATAKEGEEDEEGEVTVEKAETPVAMPAERTMLAIDVLKVRRRLLPAGALL